MVKKRYDADDAGRFGFDETKNYLTDAAAKLVPNALARRAVAVRVSTDAESYRVGDTVRIQVEFKNRLPVPVRVPTPRQRRWGWEVDGILEATDERRHVSDAPATFQFRAGERKRFAVEWNGHFRRSAAADGMDVSRPASPGDHRITAFLATTVNGERPEDSTTVRIV
ncbi:MAG: hypothetical protein V5A46_05765 [Haloferacaceae archaeon]